MKKNRKLLGVFLIIAALIIMQLPRSEADAATSASDFKIEGTTLVKYTGTDQTVIVPDTVDTIGETAFEENTNIKKVTLPSSVKKIDAYAFWGCDNLETVILGSGLTAIDDYAFANCKGLKSMTVPENIKSIGIYSFEDCVNLTDITIPVQVTEIHETAFEGCPHVVIHSETGSYADKYAQSLYDRQQEMPEYEDVSGYVSDTTVTPTPEPSDTGTNDNTSANDNQNNSQSVTDGTNSSANDSGNLLGSTKVVGNQAVVFIENAKAEVITGIPEAVEMTDTNSDGSDSSNSAAITSTYPKYTIVDGKIIADQAYYRNNTLGSVNIPSSITEIGEFAYARSTVSQLTVSEGVETIGYGAFYHCDGLAAVVLPSTLKCVEPKAFTHTAWVENFMNGLTGDGDFLVSGNTLIAYRGNSAEVTVPDGVSLIAGEAFMGHSEINKVNLPDSVEIIGEGAFEDCTSLSEIVWGQNVSAIKDRAFADCNLTNITLPDSVISVGLKAFDDNVEIVYSGNTPETTHELSAERLSNESYRYIQNDNLPSGVTVTGTDGVTARLEGAARNYYLNVTDTDGSLLKSAYNKSTGSDFPSDGIIYDMTLSESDISNLNSETDKNQVVNITKLGKQLLYVTIPLPESYSGKNVSAVSVDRNGQLESVQCQRINSDGKDCIRLSTAHLSEFGIFTDDTTFDESTVITEDTTINSLAAPEAENKGLLDALNYQTVLAALLAIAGIVCIFHTTKYIQ
jgi:hypothetical protein